MNDQQNHPLHGLGLEAMLGELVRHYGWEVLGEQININCFKSYPSFGSSMKYLRKTVWAREKLEAFYLYKFLQHPRPDDEQHKLTPRTRQVDLTRLSEEPAVISLGDGEFFDDPASGPVFPSRKSVERSRASAKHASKPTSESRSDKSAAQQPDVSEAKVNPWAKWSK